MKILQKLRAILGPLIVLIGHAFLVYAVTHHTARIPQPHRVGGYQPWGSSSSGGTPGGSVNEVQVNNGSSGFAGATNVVAGSAFISLKESGGGLPSIGVIRWDEGGDGIQARNLANTADLGVIRETSDDIIVGDSANVANVQGQVKSGGNITSVVGGSTIETIDSTGITVPNGASLGSGTRASTGTIRTSNNTTIVGVRNAANSGDKTALYTDASDNLFVGTVFPADATSFPQIFISPSTAGYLRNGDTTVVKWSATTVEVAQPIVGFASPYSVHGGITVTLDTNVTLSSAQYNYTRIAVSSTVTTTGNRNLVLPPPANPDGSDGYWKIISVNLASGVGANVSMTSTSGAVVVNGAGTSTTKSAVVWIDHAAGIIRITPDT